MHHSTSRALFTLLCRVVCMQCGANSCRHEFQRQLAALNPEADAMLRSVAHAADAKDAFERALKAGTAADARKIRSGSKDVEKVQLVVMAGCTPVIVARLAQPRAVDVYLLALIHHLCIKCYDRLLYVKCCQCMATGFVGHSMHGSNLVSTSMVSNYHAWCCGFSVCAGTCASS